MKTLFTYNLSLFSLAGSYKSKGFDDAILTNQERRVRRYHEVLNDYIEGRR